MIAKFAGKLNYPLIFITGAPRSGSTIFYQLITNYLNCLYFNNFTTMNRENLFLGFHRNQKLFDDKPHNSFTSHYGDTQGLNAPSENGYFWYKWFPTYPDYVQNYQVSAQKKQEMRKLFTAIVNYHQKPLIIKNLKMGMRLQVLADVFPEALFLFIRRDPVFLAQSIYMARQKRALQNNWWSVRPPDYQQILNYEPERQAVAQAYETEKTIGADLVRHFPGQFRTFQYSGLTNWQTTLKNIMAFLNYYEQRKNPENPKVNISNTQKLPDTVFKKITRIAADYDWDITKENHHEQ